MPEILSSPLANTTRLHVTGASSLLTYPVSLEDNFFEVKIPAVLTERPYVRTCGVLINGLYDLLRGFGIEILGTGGLQTLFKNCEGVLNDKYLFKIGMPQPPALVMHCTYYSNDLDRLLERDQAVDYLKMIQEEGIKAVLWIREA
jgi:hypothetical protein